MQRTNIQATDLFTTLAAPTEGSYKEKGSKFIAVAFPVYSETDVKDRLAETRKKYYDARHHCYAYLLGADKKIFRANDDGEPNHSAGDPILGQIRASGLSNVLVIVVRYFGGTKLGVGGLIQAYKTATAEALKEAVTIQKHETAALEITYNYDAMNGVMSLVKEFDLKITGQDFSQACMLHLEIRKLLVPEMKARFEKLDGIIAVSELEP